MSILTDTSHRLMGVSSESRQIVVQLASSELVCQSEENILGAGLEGVCVKTAV